MAMMTDVLQINQVDPKSFTKKRKRTVAACARCHERKVKCDARELRKNAPCTNCVTAGELCRNHVDARLRAPVPLDPVDDALIDRRGSETSSRIQVDDIAKPTALETANIISSLPIASGFSNHQISFQSPPQPARSDASSGFEFDHISATTLADDFNFSFDSPLTSRDSTGISDRGQSDVDRQTLPLDRFEEYIKDNMRSYAPIFQKARPSLGPSAATQDTPVSQDSFTDGSSIPFAVDLGSRSTIDLEQQVNKLDAADMDYLRAKGAFDLPPWEVQKDLVEAYFSEIHPTAPVVNRTQFMTRFLNHQVESRLLMFAIFTAGAKACRNPWLLDHKGTVHGSAHKFFKATKALLDTGYEKDKIVIIQALLLITWWWDKKDDGGRNMRACTVDAINTAQSIGMHRWDQYPKSDRVLLGLWKRIWWSIVNRDVGVATFHGVTCILRASDHDVYFLEPADWIEDYGSPGASQQFVHDPVEIAFFIEQTKVIEIQHEIHMTNFLRYRLQRTSTGSITQRQAIDPALAAPPGIKQLPPIFQDDYNDRSFILSRDWLSQVPDLACYDVDDVRGHRFWPAFLHILFYNNVCMRFREKSVSRPQGPNGLAEREYCQSRGIAAATMIYKIARNMKAHVHIARCTGLLTNCIFNALIFFLIEGQSPNESVREDAQAKYSLCLNVLYDFSQLWISASLIHKLFEGLQASMISSKRTYGQPFLEHNNSPIGGLRLSSEISNSVMKELLDTPFLWEESNGDHPRIQHMSDVVQDGIPAVTLEQFEHEFPTFGHSPGLPDNLNFEIWCSFFGMSPD